MRNGMKLGKRVTFTKHYKPAHTYSPAPWSLVAFGTRIHGHTYEFPRYTPTECELTGIITGYKRITPRSIHETYAEPQIDEIGCPTTIKCSKFVSSVSEYVYVVQTTLTKKYYVKAEWIKEG